MSKIIQQLKDVVAGVTVDEFLKTINENFAYFTQQFSDLQEEGQLRKITFRTEGPESDEIGEDGDIWIVYEDTSDTVAD